MKAGTTTLYSDLLQHPEIFLPSNKEPEVLCNVDTEQEMLKAYKRIFWNKKSQTLIGEASTAYSMYPDKKDIAEKAFRFIGNNLKIIYLVRDPIDRIISHHYHDFLLGRVDKDINKVVLRDEKYINYSKYWMQIICWLNMYEKNQIKVVSFEGYIKDREKTLRSIQDFLGVDYYEIDVTGAANVSSKKLVPNFMVEKFITNNLLYKNYLKPMLPGKVISNFSQLLMSKPKVKPDPLSIETKEIIRSKLKYDYMKFSNYFDLFELSLGEGEHENIACYRSAR